MLNQVGQRWVWHTTICHVLVEVVEVSAGITEIKVVHTYPDNSECYRLKDRAFVSQPDFAKCPEYFTLLEGQDAPKE